MISAADFCDLFPWIFRSGEADYSVQSQQRPTDICIARWEDDGGRPVSYHALDCIRVLPTEPSI